MEQVNHGGQIEISIDAEGGVRRLIRAHDSADERRLLGLYGRLTPDIDRLTRAAQLVAEDAAALVQRTAVVRGLPEHVADHVVLDRVAALVGRARDNKKAVPVDRRTRTATTEGGTRDASNPTIRLYARFGAS